MIEPYAGPGLELLEDFAQEGKEIDLVEGSLCSLCLQLSWFWPHLCYLGVVTNQTGFS